MIHPLHILGCAVRRRKARRRVGEALDGETTPRRRGSWWWSR